MKTWSAVIENLKCGGCENSVRRILMNIEGVQSAEVDSNTGNISVEYIGSDISEKARESLRKAGYAPQGESTFRDKAVSYVSCMKGRLSEAK